MATRRRDHDDQHNITRSSSQRTANRHAQKEEEEEEREQEITRLRTREQRLKRKIRVLQSVNEETRVELEELREVVETLVETVESSNGLSTIRPARLSFTAGLLEPAIPSSTLRDSERQSCMKTIQDAHKRIASLEAQLATREAELAKSLVSLNGSASLGGRSKPSLGVTLEAETVAQALDWAVSRNKALELEIGILADKITSVKSTAKDSSRDISSLPKPLPKTSKKTRGTTDGLSRSVPGSTPATRTQLDSLPTASSSTATLTPTPLPNEPSRLYQSTNQPPRLQSTAPMTEEEFPPRRPRRPQAQQQQPKTERVPSIGTAGYNSLSEQMHALKAQIDGFEDEKGEREDGARPTPSASPPTPTTVTTKDTRSRQSAMSQSTPAIGLSMGSFNPISSSSPLPPRKLVRTSSLGSNAPNTTAARQSTTAARAQLASSSVSRRPTSQTSSQPPPSQPQPQPPPSRATHASTNVATNTNTGAQHTEHDADGGGPGTNQDLIDALSSQIDAFGKQVEAFRVERERWKEVVGGGASRKGTTQANEPLRSDQPQEEDTARIQGTAKTTGKATKAPATTTQERKRRVEDDETKSEVQWKSGDRAAVAQRSGEASAGSRKVAVGREQEQDRRLDALETISKDLVQRMERVEQECQRLRDSEEARVKAYDEVRREMKEEQQKRLGDAPKREPKAGPSGSQDSSDDRHHDFNDNDYDQHDHPHGSNANANENHVHSLHVTATGQPTHEIYQLQIQQPQQQHEQERLVKEPLSPASETPDEDDSATLRPCSQAQVESVARQQRTGRRRSSSVSVSPAEQGRPPSLPQASIHQGGQAQPQQGGQAAQTQLGDQATTTTTTPAGAPPLRTGAEEVPLPSPPAEGDTAEARLAIDRGVEGEDRENQGREEEEEKEALSTDMELDSPLVPTLLLDNTESVVSGGGGSGINSRGGEPRAEQGDGGMEGRSGPLQGDEEETRKPARYGRDTPSWVSPISPPLIPRPLMPDIQNPITPDIVPVLLAAEARGVHGPVSPGSDNAPTSPAYSESCSLDHPATPQRLEATPQRLIDTPTGLASPASPSYRTPLAFQPNAHPLLAAALVAGGVGMDLEASRDGDGHVAEDEGEDHGKTPSVQRYSAFSGLSYVSPGGYDGADDYVHGDGESSVVGYGPSPSARESTPIRPRQGQARRSVGGQMSSRARIQTPFRGPGYTVPRSSGYDESPSQSQPDDSAYLSQSPGDFSQHQRYGDSPSQPGAASQSAAYESFRPSQIVRPDARMGFHFDSQTMEESGLGGPSSSRFGGLAPSPFAKDDHGPAKRRDEDEDQEESGIVGIPTSISQAKTPMRSRRRPGGTPHPSRPHNPEPGSSMSLALVPAPKGTPYPRRAQQQLHSDVDASPSAASEGGMASSVTSSVRAEEDLLQFSPSPPPGNRSRNTSGSLSRNFSFQIHSRQNSNTTTHSRTPSNHSRTPSAISAHSRTLSGGSGFGSFGHISHSFGGNFASFGEVFARARKEREGLGAEGQGGLVVPMQSTPLERSPAAAVGHAEDERMNRQESSERFGEGEGQGGQSYQEDVGGGALRDSHLDDRDRFEEGHDEQQAHTTPPPSQPQRRIQERTPYPDDIDDIDLDDDESDESLDTLNALLLAMRDPTQAARVRGLRSPVMTDGERSLTTGMASMGMMSMSMTEGVRGGLRVGMMGGLNRSLVNDMSHEMGEEEQDEEEEDERRSSRDGRPDVSTEEVSMVEVSMVEGNSTGERSRFVGAEWEREGYSREASSGQYSLENRRGYDRDDEGGYDSQSAHGYGHEDRYRDLGHHGRRGHHLDALEEEEEEEYESGGEDEDDGGTRPWEDEEGDGGTWRFPADDDP